MSEMLGQECDLESYHNGVASSNEARLIVIRNLICPSRKKCFYIKNANKQRSQTKNATDQEGAKSDVNKIEYINTHAVTPSDDRTLLGIVLDDRGIALYL